MCAQFIELCRWIGLLWVASVAIDGSKFKAVNNRDRNFTKAKMARRMQQIEDSVARYLQQLDTADRQDPTAAISSRVDRLHEKISRLRKHKLIFAGSECVARTPPMADLFDPCPWLAN